MESFGANSTKVNNQRTKAPREQYLIHHLFYLFEICKTQKQTRTFFQLLKSGSVIFQLELI